MQLREGGTPDEAALLDVAATRLARYKLPKAFVFVDEVVRSLPPNLRTPYNRAALAQNILACASTGERDPDELRRAALMEPKVSAAA